MTAIADPADYLLKLPDPPIRSNETRMENAFRCRQLVWRLIREDDLRGYYRAVVKACYDGAAPYSDRQRAENGGRWTANLNFMELQAIMDNARIPYYALFSGVENYCRFYSNYQPENPEHQRWADIVSMKWTKMLKRWKQFPWHMKASQFEMLFEGWGPVMWEDEVNWRFRSIPARNVLVPQRSESCLDERVPYVAVRCSYRVHELYDRISDPEIAEKRGWDVEAVKFAIRYATRGVAGETWRTRNWEYWEQMFKNHDIWGSYTQCDIINCAHVFVQEFAVDGKPPKVSHFLILEGSTAEEPTFKEGETNYLFKSVNIYDSYAQAMVVCFQNTGDGTWHSVRGIGLKAFKFVELRNRLKCNQVNNAMLAGMMVLQPTTEQAKDKVQNIRFGFGVAWIPSNCNFVQNRLGGDIAGPMAVDRMLGSDLASNVGQYSGNTISREDGRGERPTATEVEYASSKETSLTQGQIDAYYADLDSIYEEMFRRATEHPDAEAQRFLDECYDSGVPKEFIEKMECVQANRLSGYPSPDSRKRNLQQISGIIQSLPEDGRSALLDEIISTYCGPDKVAVFNPKMQKPDIDAWAAVQENDSLHNGVQPLVISGMNHVVHLQIHLQDAEERLAPLQESIEAGEPLDESTLMQAYQYVGVLGAHCEQHIAELASDPARAGLAKMFETQLKNVAAFHGKLRGAILDARRQAQQQALEEQQATALGIMDQAKLASMQAEQQRKDFATQHDQQRKDWKAEQAQRLKTWQTGQNQRLAAATTISSINLDAAKTAADIRNKRLNGSSSKGSK